MGFEKVRPDFSNSSASLGQTGAKAAADQEF
jgi:hypothetical protein